MGIAVLSEEASIESYDELLSKLDLRIQLALAQQIIRRAAQEMPATVHKPQTAFGSMPDLDVDELLGILEEGKISKTDTEPF